MNFSYIMNKCGNCKKDISGLFRRRRECLICKLRFCSKCFYLCQKNISKYSTKGYCCNCYISSNPENIEYPKYTGDPIPRRNTVIYKQYIKEMKESINIIRLDPFTEFRKLGQLGEGATSQVFKVINQENKTYALKVLKDSIEDHFAFDEFFKQFMSNCSNVVSCYALYYSNKQYSMLFEYMDMTLTEFNSRLVHREENVIAYIIREILNGILYMHSRFTIHRDMKPDNIFINRKGEVKIGDLGFNAQLFREQDIRETVVGSPLWTAPEVLGGRKYAMECDIWSIGMICIELAEGNPRFSKIKNQLELLIRLQHNPEPRLDSPWSSNIQEFVSLSVQKDQQMRKTASELLECAFIQNINESEAIEAITKIVNSHL